VPQKQDSIGGVAVSTFGILGVVLGMLFFGALFTSEPMRPC
jgi:hypothetical protein